MPGELWIRNLRLCANFLLCLICAALGHQLQFGISQPGSIVLTTGMALLGLLLAYAFQDVANWNLVLLLGFCFTTGMALRVFLQEPASVPRLEILFTGTAALVLSIGLGQALPLDRPVLQNGIWASGWLYAGIWVLLGLGVLGDSIRAWLALVGIFLFSLAAAIWSSSLDGRLSTSAPGLALELYLLSVNLLIAGWALWTV